MLPSPAAATKIGSPRWPANTRFSISTNIEKIYPIIMGIATYARFLLISQ
jgi:hypothetical protein